MDLPISLLPKIFGGVRTPRTLIVNDYLECSTQGRARFANKTAKWVVRRSSLQGKVSEDIYNTVYLVIFTPESYLATRHGTSSNHSPFGGGYEWKRWGPSSLTASLIRL